MKIYVDGELPKNCGECPFNYDSVGCDVFEPKTGEDGYELKRCLDAMYGDLVKDAITDRRFSKCPLQTTQSIKQKVREEVVEEIKKRLAEQRTKMQNDTHCYQQTVVCWQYIVAILDQVRGENNVKD